MNLYEQSGATPISYYINQKNVKKNLKLIFLLTNCINSYGSESKQHLEYFKPLIFIKKCGLLHYGADSLKFKFTQACYLKL